MGQPRINWDALHTISAVAATGIAPKILYKKLSDAAGTWRTIEPYQLLETSDGVSLHSWQLHPELGENVVHAWRKFRIDRIEDAMESEVRFKPRRQVIFEHSHIEGLRLLHTSTPRTAVAEYRDALLAAIADGVITDDERSAAAEIAEHVASKHRKVVHAQIYQQVLFDVLLDGQISPQEEDFLDSVRSLLDELGWSP